MTDTCSRIKLLAALLLSADRLTVYLVFSFCSCHESLLACAGRGGSSSPGPSTTM